MKNTIAMPATPAGSDTPPSHPPGALTVLRVEGIATKRIRWQNGQLVRKDAPEPACGTYRVEVATDVQQLRIHIESLSTSEALIWGVPPHPGGEFVTKKVLANLNGTAPPTTIARDGNHFSFAPKMGWIMLDFDYVPDGATLDSLRDVLISAAAGLATLPMLGMSSASANIYFRGQCLRGLTGARIYIPVADARQIPHLGQLLFDRLVLDGHGRVDITKSGQLKIRSPIDSAVWQSNRLDYAAGANVEPPLQQRREIRAWHADSTARLDERTIPALSAQEQARLREITTQLKAQKKAEAASVREAYKAERAAAGHNVAWTEDGDRIILDGDHTITLASGEQVTVDEILADRARFSGHECADPVEPDYHGDGRIAVIHTDRTPNIYSHAHGGQTYLLRQSAGVAFGADTEATPERHPKLEPHIARYNERYALVRRLKNVVLDIPPGGGRPDYLPIEHWRTLTANERVAVNSKQVPISQLWIAHPDRRTFDQVVNDSTQLPYSTVGNSFNLWPGFAIPPSAEGNCELLLEHIRDVICRENEERYQWVMMWLAAMVQHPERKPGTALVLRGVQGAGKSLLGAVMGRILGDTLVVEVSRPDELTGQFNSHLEGRLLIQVEEAFFAGDKSSLGRLKHKITSPWELITRKYMEPVKVADISRLIITSNESWVVHADLDHERRMMVLDVAPDHARDKAYFNRLFKELDEMNGYARFHQHLRELAVDWDHIGQPLATEALRLQQDVSMSAEMKWLYDLLGDGSLPGDARGEGVADRDALYNEYARFLREHHESRRASKDALGRLLKTTFQVGSSRPRVAGAPGPRRYVFPPLATCRQLFDQHFVAPHEWDGPDTWQTDEIASVIHQPEVTLQEIHK